MFCSPLFKLDLNIYPELAARVHPIADLETKIPALVLDNSKLPAVKNFLIFSNRRDGVLNMSKFLQIIGLAATGSLIVVAPSFAVALSAVPSPEIGGTTLGMILAGGVAFYIGKRRKR
jgi:hypothetical protein